MSSLREQVALITGGGRGIGAATAHAFAQAGAAVALVARTQAELDATAGAIQAAGGRVMALACDIRDADAFEGAHDLISEALGPVDVLVNNAGLFARGPSHLMEEPTWDAVLDVNLKAAWTCSRAVLPAMLARGTGRVLNVSSISGTLGTPELAAYCASKWGLIGLTKSMAIEYKAQGVFFASVLPGSVDTQMLAQAAMFPPDMGPEAVANTLLYLAAEAPFAMTGAALEIFG